MVEAGFCGSCSHLIPGVSLFAPVYLQYQLNKVWETQPEPMIGSGSLAPAHA